MSARALLVDMDGTLVDTANANFTAYRDALAEVGVAVDRARFDTVALGRNWRQFLPTLLDEAGSTAAPAAVAQRKQAIYPSKLSLTEVNQPLVALIAAGRPGWKTALVTTAAAASANAVLDTHGLRALFDLIVTGSDVQAHKPDPEAYVLAAEQLNVAPADCLVIEDSDIGVAAADAFGARCLRVMFPPR